MNPTSLAPSQTSTEDARKASGNLRMVPCISSVVPTDVTLCSAAPLLTMNTWSPENSFNATGEWVVTKACCNGSFSFAPSKAISRIIRCGSRPCSSSSSRMTPVLDATSRCRAVTSRRVEPTPKFDNGTPFPSCSEIEPPANDIAPTSRRALAPAPSSIPTSCADLRTTSRVFFSCSSAWSPKLTRASRATAAKAAVTSTLSSESRCSTEPRRHAR